MIAPILLAVAMPPPVEPEIVVIGRRIAAAQLTLSRDTAGRNQCALSRSSGDARIDRALCRRAAKCLGRGPVVQTKVDACIQDRKARLLADWRRGLRE